MAIDYEYHEPPMRPLWAWALVLALAVGTLAWGGLIFWAVDDRPREWDYPVLPQTPGESVYSSEPTPRPKEPPPQIEPLPETQPAEGSK